jgi:type IV pilus modification protein PilV
MMPRRMHSPKHASGFTIAEILAALLVMAVGVIGVAALYSDQVHTTPEIELHQKAATLAESIAARIRATKEGRTGYATTVGIVCNPKAKTPLAQDAAAQEAACWEDEVEQKLPSGLGTITRDLSTTPATYVVAVSWSAPEAGAASYVIRIEPES